ncbi:hypothetical protein [Streptomyces boluensis]|uniref:Uncharacterized protein n=1 Tax=Streptomyces boluensis TaxID=1775135 RepID=A0A964USW0_9ACTN|nr:hypothetical protein [Streptomyces boluensis]NBE54701.1 hypothetical protein [Streptomyces boluensis]
MTRLDNTQDAAGKAEAAQAKKVETATKSVTGARAKLKTRLRADSKS